MQLHDSFLESKIRAIETSRKPDRKFKLANGILYHLPPDTNQYVLCVPRTICEPIVFELHNGSSFHFPSQHLDHLLKLILYCKDSTKITQHIVKTCPVCLLSAPRTVRRIIGEQRTHLSVKQVKHWCAWNRWNTGVRFHNSPEIIFRKFKASYYCRFKHRQSLRIPIKKFNRKIGSTTHLQPHMCHNQAGIRGRRSWFWVQIRTPGPVSLLQYCFRGNKSVHKILNEYGRMFHQALEEGPEEDMSVWSQQLGPAPSYGARRSQ